LESCIYMKNKLIKGYIFAVLSAIIYGSMPLMARHIYADGVNAVTLVFLRNALALPSLAIITFLKHRTLKVPLATLPKIGLISIFGCCFTPILLFSSYSFIATGTATVFHFIYPSLVVLISIIFVKKKVPFVTIMSVMLCFVGICLFYDPSESFDIKGGILALASGLTFAIYVVLLSNYKNNSVNGLLLCFYIVIVSSISSFLICIFTGSLALPQTLSGWLLCGLFAFLVTTVAVAFFQLGAAIIGGEKTSILSVLEPITGILIGFIAFDERISLSVIAGSVLVIAATTLIAISDVRRSSKNKQ